MSGESCSEVLASVAKKGANLKASIEIEAYRDFAMTQLLAPADGTLRSFFTHETIPPYLIKVAERNGIVPRGGTHLDVKWDDLDASQRHYALQRIKGGDFAVDRRVPGLAVAQEVRVSPKSDFIFRGRQYQAGKVETVRLDGFLQPKVEYASDSMNSSFLELHFETAGDVRQLREDIDIFFKEVLPNSDSYGRFTGQPVSEHIHVTGVVPKAFFKQNKEKGFTIDDSASGLVFYAQAVELEMILNLMENLGFFGSVFKGDDPIFDFMSQDTMPILRNYFRGLYSGKHINIYGPDTKINYVGVRSGQTYGDLDLWGLELRLPTQGGNTVYSEVAQGVKKTLKNQDFPVDMKAVKKFRKDSNNIEQALRNTWFRRPPEEAAALVKNESLKAQIERIQELHRFSTWEYSEGKRLLTNPMSLVFFEWAEHPLFAGDILMSEKISKLQLELLESAERNRALPVERVINFMEHSGIRAKLREIVYRD